jgi:hypothetical protein
MAACRRRAGNDAQRVAQSSLDRAMRQGTQLRCGLEAERCYYSSIPRVQ